MRSFEHSSLMPGQGTRRLFIGLMATASARAAIDDFRSMWHWPAQARLVASADLHVTLHFLGEVAETVEDLMREELDEVPVPPLSLELQPCEMMDGGFAVLRVVDDSRLRLLRDDIGTALRRVGLPVAQGPFRPHVTLARRADGARWPSLLAPIPWAVSGFTLMWSRRDAYQPLESWPAPVSSRARIF